MSVQNGISFRPTAIPGCTIATDDTPTDIQTDHTTVTSVALGGIAFSDTAL